MQVARMIDAVQDGVAPRTPPRGGADSVENEGEQADNDSNDESGDEEDGSA